MMNIDRIIQSQREFYASGRTIPVKFRIEMLKKLYYASAMIFGRAQSNLELALGRPDKAALAMEKTAELYPEDPFLCAFHRGVAAMFRNDPASAAAHFEDALRIHPDDDFTRKNYEAARNKIVTAP